MNFQLVARITGILLLLVAAAMFGCGLFARLDVVAGDHEAMVALMKSAAITGGVALALVLAGGFGPSLNRIPRREAVVVVGLGWLLSSAFGGLPFMLCTP